MNAYSLSVAGIWTAIPGAPFSVASFRSLFHAPDGNLAIAFSGWAYSGWVNNQPFNQTHAFVLKLGPDGLMHDATAETFKNAVTNGTGSVVVSDFNGDGKDDIFFAAFNETPAISKPSTLYLSNISGSYDRIEIADLVQSHSAQLGNLNGRPIITTAGYGENKPYYSFDTAKNTLVPHYWGNTYLNNFNGSSSAVADLDGDGKSEIIITDSRGNPGNPNDGTPWKIAIYHLNGDSFGDAPARLLTPYFDTHKDQYPNNVGMGPGLDHVFRVRTDDFNYDGKLDIVTTNTIWTATAVSPPSIIQLLQNQGNLVFADKTDAFISSYDKSSTPPDYSMSMLDIDGSGIKSYLMGTESYSGSKNSQGNYLLLNDGTGHFYIGLHTEFDAIVPSIKSYLASAIPGCIVQSEYPSFIGFQNSSGSIDYVAEIMISNNFISQKALINVPIHYSPTTDFHQDIVISDRNSSKLMRTFAGNDIITDNNANASAHIDGGLGLDRALYKGTYRSYTLSNSSDGFHVSGNSISDTLINVERLQFSDKIVALDIQGNAGQAYRLYKAALDRTPDERGLAGWIKFMDEGGALNTMAQQFINSQEFNVKYGALDNTGFINQLYKNVLARNGEPTGVAGWVGGLNNGLSRAEVLKGFSESAENQANVIGQIKDGIPYEEWWLA